MGIKTRIFKNFLEILGRMKEEVIKLLNSAGVERQMAESLLEIPPDSAMGDFAFPCFKLAGVLRKSPAQIAKELEGKLKLSKGIEKVVAVGPYLNFFVNKGKRVAEVLERISKEKEKFGSGVRGKGKTITIDFSQPNIMKPFNIAHLRSTMIGNALSRILNYDSYKVIRINHLGDWGTQFGKMMYAYEAWGNKTELLKDPMHYMTNLYVRFHKEAEMDPSLEDRGREWFAKLEQGDKTARAYWELFSKLSLKYYNKTYTRLGITFDSWAGEAFYEPMLKDTIAFLQKKRIVKKSEGALIVDLEQYGITPCIIQKSDGSTIYATRDLAAAMYRAKTYNFYKNLYVVDVRQSLHFQQVFKTLDLAGFPWAKDCIHLPFGTMKFEEGVMSTRKGIIIFLEDVLDKVVDMVKEIIKEKNPKLKNKDKIAEQIGLGAVVFWDLSNDRVNDIIFDWKRVLDFEGDTAPYVQYTHARACAILRKAKAGKADYSLLKEAEEIALVKALGRLPDVVQKSAEEYKPHHIAKYLLDVCHLFNEFYHKHQVLVEDEELKMARLSLVLATKQVLANGLYLLGIKAPEEM